jgi:hypothetical protein
MGIDASKPKRDGLGDEDSEYSFAGRKGTDLCQFFGFETGGDELGQVRPLLVEDAQGSITSTGHRASFIDDMAQQDSNVKISLDEQHGVEYPPQRDRVFN